MSRGTKERLTVDFLSETINYKAEGKHLKVLKGNCQLKILYSLKIPFKNCGGIRTFSDIKNLKEIITRKLTLQEMLKRYPSSKEK